MRRSQFLTVMGVLLVPGMLVLLAPRAWAEFAGVPAEAQSVAPAPALTGTCIVKKVSFATSESIALGTTSTSFVNIPDMSVGFSMGGANPSCVKVEFSAFAFAANTPVANQLLMVRALLDGVTAGSPSEVQLSGDDDEDADGSWARAHGYNFAFNGVTPGVHTITIQFRSNSGGSVFVHRPSMFVNHR